MTPPRVRLPPPEEVERVRPLASEIAKLMVWRLVLLFVMPPVRRMELPVNV
jgi:hypothetical protein